MKLFVFFLLFVFGNSFSLDKECIQIKRTGEYECASYLRIHDTIVVMYYTNISAYKTVKKTFVLDSVVLDSVILSREIVYRKVSRKYILENVPQKANEVDQKTNVESKLFVLGSIIAVGSGVNFIILTSAGIPMIVILPGTLLGIALGAYLAQ